MSASLRFVVLVCVALLPGRVAEAWTDARARSADVVVELAEDGWAWVAFDVGLQVRGGWLEGYEISGLDPDARLDALKTPVLVGEQGQKWTPRARMRSGGRLSLSFDRRGAPRRGDYRLRFAYRTELLPRSGERTGAGGTQVRWTLPAWRTGLDAVQVWFWAPADDARGVAPSTQAEPAATRALGARTLLHFHRLHLPRATPWTVAVELPASGSGPPSAAPRPVEAPRWLVSRPDWCGAAVTLLALFAMAWVQRRRATRCDMVLAHLLGSGPRALAVSAACVVAAVFLSGPLRWAALALAVVSTLTVPARQRVPLQLGSWRRVGSPERRAARLSLVRDAVGLVRHPDPLSLLPLGGLAAMLHWSLQGEPALRPGLAWVATCFALACACSSVRFGGDRARPLLSVFRLASRLRVGGVALSVRAFFTAGGLAQQPRLSVHPRAPIAGLLRLELSPQRGAVQRYALLATVKSSSAADRWLSELGSHRIDSPGKQRACHLWHVADARVASARIQELLADCAERSHRVVSRAA